MNLNLLSEEQALRLESLIRGAAHIVVTCHNRPDGDALGSSLGWAEYLRVHYNKEAVVVVPGPYPDFLQWLPGTERVVRYSNRPQEVERLFGQADLVFCMDINCLNRLEALEPVAAACGAPRVLVDHHEDPRVEAEVVVSYPDLSSTAELVFRMVWQLGGYEELSKKFAVLIYTGMMTDTGNFAWSASYPEIYYVISMLLTKRINTTKIYNNVYHNYSQWAVRLRGYLMSQKLNVLADGQASYYTITRGDMRDFKFVRGDVEGLVNVPLSIKGMKCSIQLREDDRVDNKIWVSLRSVDQFSVEDMARRFFNGGGHLNASGGQLSCSLAEAERIAREAIKHYFGG